ncbi:MAG: hypothetical protein VB934_02025 [Polyangiaceae bacterium]
MVKIQWLLALFVAVATIGGCSVNEAATKKCNKDKDCAACCKVNGATGNASGTVNGEYGCKCMGG